MGGVGEGVGGRRGLKGPGEKYRRGRCAGRPCRPRRPPPEGRVRCSRSWLKPRCRGSPRGAEKAMPGEGSDAAEQAEVSPGGGHHGAACNSERECKRYCWLNCY